MVTVHHGTVEIDGIRIFYREAGMAGAPALVLPHGYPASSFQFRNFMAALGDEFYLVAPDFPGSGYSDVPEGFDYSFGGFGALLGRFTERMGLERFALYLQDFGGWIGLRMAMQHPERVAAVIIQNNDVYEDAMGPKYAGLKAFLANPTVEAKAKLGEAVSEEGFRDEFLNDVRPDLADRIPPDMWRLHWSLMTERRKAIALEVIASFGDNLQWWPRYRDWYRQHQPPALILWGPQDGYMPEAAGRAYLRDLPEAELHMLDAGHWLLETSLDEAVALTRAFLHRVQQKQKPRS